jgi:hypothetical protein
VPRRAHRSRRRRRSGGGRGAVPPGTRGAAAEPLRRGVPEARREPAARPEGGHADQPRAVRGGGTGTTP